MYTFYLSIEPFTFLKYMYHSVHMKCAANLKCVNILRQSAFCLSMHSGRSTISNFGEGLEAIKVKLQS